MKFKCIETNSTIVFWQELWIDLINNYSKNPYGLEMSNPHLLIIDIINEVEVNYLKNASNIKVLSEKLNFFIKYDTVLLSNYKAYFFLLKNEIQFKKGKKYNKLYILNLCKKILNIFTEGGYFVSLQNDLKNILLTELLEKIDKEKLKYISQSIIVEYTLKGFSIDSIKKFAINIFRTYLNLPDKNIFSPQFPIEINITDYYDDNVFDNESYKKDVIAIIDKLTINERIDGLLTYFFKKAKSVYYIFHLDGLTGEIDITYGNVNIYSEKKKQYIKVWQFHHSKIEEFKKTASGTYVINCAVKMNYIDDISTKFKAIEKVEEAIGLLRFHFRIKSQIFIDSTISIVIDSEGKQIGLHLDNHNVNPYKLRLDNNNSFINTLINNGNELFKITEKNTVEKSLIKAIYWFKKGIESKKHEDKILNYWIAIECLLKFKSIEKLSDIDRARKYLPILHMATIHLSTCWDLFYEIVFDKINEEVIPEDILKKCGIFVQVGEKTNIKKFVENLPILIQYVKSDYTKHKINNVISFFNDKDVFLNYINKEKNKIENDILTIYRYRNQIVHNAFYNEGVFEYYMSIAENLAQSLIFKILTEYWKNSEVKIDSILVQALIDYDQFMLNLKDGEIMDVFFGGQDSS